MEDFGGTFSNISSSIGDRLTIAYLADGTSDDIFAKHSKTETDEGTAIIKELLNEWKMNVDALADDGDTKMELSENEQIEQLRIVAEKYKERFESSSWIKDVRTAF